MCAREPPQGDIDAPDSVAVELRGDQCRILLAVRGKMAKSLPEEAYLAFSKISVVAGARNHDSAVVPICLKSLMQDSDHIETTLASATYLSQILQDVRIVVFVGRGFEELSQFIQHQNNWSLTSVLRYVLHELAIALGRALLFLRGTTCIALRFSRRRPVSG
jgi:hypothetical protein